MVQVQWACSVVLKRRFGRHCQVKLGLAQAFVKRCRSLSPEPKSSAGRGAVKLIKELDLSEGTDVVVEASGSEPSLQTDSHVVRTGGSYVQGG